MFTKIIAGALLSTALGAQVQAQSLEIGSGIFCDTQAEMERFVTLFAGDAQATINAVNAEMKDPTACVAATIALIRGREVASLRSWNETYQIVQVTVLGVLTTAGVKAIAPTTIYSVKRLEERDA
jgi:hypothetical protein